MSDKQIYIAVFVVLFLFIIFIISKKTSSSEHLGVPFFLDQMAMSYSDPTWFNYLGYERDVAGMSSRDYYLENQLNASTKAAPQYLENNSNFIDHTNYMDMPIKYRPGKRNASATQINSELNSNNLEELAYLDLNKVGQY